MVSCTKRGKHYGDDFERLIAHQAAVDGMLLVVHGLQARYIGPKRIVGVKSDLDMRLHYQGRTVVFDAKSRAGATVPLSGLDPRQRALATRYTLHGLRAGFLAELRKTDEVVFFDAQAIARVGERGSLSAKDGLLLGSTRRFALALMFG